MSVRSRAIVGAAACRQRTASREGVDGGFAAVDALVALSILASTVVFSIAGVHTALQTSRAAFETRRGAQILEALVLQATVEPGVREGRAGGASWRVAVGEAEPVAGAGSVCPQTVSARFEGTGRALSLASTAVCVADVAP